MLTLQALRLFDQDDELVGAMLAADRGSSSSVPTCAACGILRTMPDIITGRQPFRWAAYHEEDLLKPDADRRAKGSKDFYCGSTYQLCFPHLTWQELSCFLSIAHNSNNKNNNNSCFLFCPVASFLLILLGCLLALV
jgi:hypothetical protein